MNSETPGRIADDEQALRLIGSNGNVLKFRLLRHSSEEAIFEVSMHSAWLSAKTQMTTYAYGSPAKFFDEMAASWRGWEGEKSWQEIEGRIALHATADRLGHIAVAVHLRHDAGQCARALEIVLLDAGAMERLASRVHRFFDAYPIKCDAV